MAKIVSSRYVLTCIRFVLIIALLKSSVIFSVSWTSLICSTSLAFTFIISRSKKFNLSSLKLYLQDVAPDNPFKGKIGPGYLSKERDSEIAKAVAEFVLYDAKSVASVTNFSVIKNNTECIFAKRSKVWGSPDYDDSLSLEENIRRLIPTFYKFTMAFQDLALDAFLIELPGSLYGGDIQVFGKAVRSVLFTMCQSDVWRQKQALLKNVQKLNEAAVENHLRSLTVDTATWTRRSWVFQFNKVTFFVTTFAPFYPETNSRYAFGCDNCYILFQPEMSFAIHNLPPDTAETNWTRPITVRDKIRVAFKDAGRPYEPALKQGKPMICEIVKEIHPGEESTSWWLLP